LKTVKQYICIEIKSLGHSLQISHELKANKRARAYFYNILVEMKKKLRNLKNKKLVISIVFFFLSFYLFKMLDDKYSEEISQIFWTILFLIIIVSIYIDKKKKIKIYSNVALILFILAQTIVLLIPIFHEFIYNLFKWSSW